MTETAGVDVATAGLVDLLIDMFCCNGVGGGGRCVCNEITLIVDPLNKGCNSNNLSIKDAS